MVDWLSEAKSNIGLDWSRRQQLHPLSLRREFVGSCYTHLHHRKNGHSPIVPKLHFALFISATQTGLDLLYLLTLQWSVASCSRVLLAISYGAMSLLWLVNLCQNVSDQELFLFDIFQICCFRDERWTMHFFLQTSVFLSCLSSSDFLKHLFNEMLLFFQYFFLL